MNEHEPDPTVPRTPPVEQPTDDTEPRAAEDSSADPNRTADLRPVEVGTYTVARTPSDVARQQTEAQARAAAGVPGYVLLRELGHGGMGVVYEARHLKLNRIVALKMMRGDEQAGRGELTRFLAEAEAVAAIKHENVVQVYDYGEADGRPFMALEFCPGGTLGTLLPEDSGAARAPDEMAALIAKVARGVAAAHALGIIHRDLKPGNVFLDEHGVPKVADFGLAKRGAGADVTREGTGMGSPAYMAPEQAQDAKFVGPQADVWALGVILYEVLTGKRPFTGTVQEILAKARNTEPLPPRKFASSVPRDLDLICLHCLAKAPHERYPTAQALADDLDRYARGEPISVRPAGPAERLAKWARRKPTAAAACGLSALAALLAVVAGAVVVLWRDAETARDLLAGEKKSTESARDEALKQQGIAEAALGGEAAAKKEVERHREILARVNYGRTIQIVYQAWKDGRIAEARALLATTRSDLRGWEYHHVHRLCHADVVTLVHAGRVETAAYSRDGTRVATADEYGTARVWDAATGKMLVELKGHAKTVHGVSFSANGQRVATASADGTARVWDAANGMVVAELKGHKGWVRSAAFSPDGARVVTAGGNDGTARVWDAATGKMLVELKGHTDDVRSAAFNRDGTRALTASWDGTARVWDPGTGKQVAELKRPEDQLESAAFSPDGTRVVVCGDGGGARVLDAASGKVLVELKGHKGWVRSAAFSPDGTRIVTAGDDRTVRVWVAASGAQVAELKGHTQRVWSIAFGPGGRRVVTASDDGTARFWDTARPAVVELRGHVEPVTDAAISPDGARVVTASLDRTDRPVWVWDARSGAPVGLLPGGPGVRWVSFSRDGSRLLNTPLGGVPTVWDMARGKPLAVLGGKADTVASAAISPDGARVVTAGARAGAHIWDASSGKPLVQLKGTTQPLSSISFSRDGARVAAACDDRSAYVWNAGTSELAATLPHPKRISRVTFSPDGTRLVTACGDESARVWGAATGELLAVFKVPDDSISAASFSPDGTRVVAAGASGIARVWDPGGTVIAELRGHAGAILSCSYSPDVKRIVTSGTDGTLRLWDPEAGAELLALPGTFFAKFSADGAQIVTRGERENVVIVYDTQPLNAASARSEQSAPGARP
jgi:WD40 repeat protein/tRNA A-37 threonylcarbamoyl transferase component Bud32